MTSQPDEPSMQDVMDTSESAVRDRTQHGGAPAHPNDDVLEHRTEQERVQAGLSDFATDEIAPATD